MVWKRKDPQTTVSISTRKEPGTGGQGPKRLPGPITNNNWIFPSFFFGIGQRNDLISKIISRWSSCWVDHEA